MTDNAQQILATYRMATEEASSIEQICNLLAAEMSVGTEYVATPDGPRYWHSMDRLDLPIQSSLAEVIDILPSGDEFVFQIRLPAANIALQHGGIANLLAVVAGDAFGMGKIEQLSLEELRLPPAWLQYYQGPRWGVEGIRQLLEIPSGPLIGAILKPNLGLSCEQTADLCGQLAQAGVDVIKDDEIAISPTSCPLRQRVRTVRQTLDRVQAQTGQKVLYVPNITSDLDTLAETASEAIEAGAGALLVDALTVGITSIHFIKQKWGLPVYVHRAMYGLLSKNSRYKICTPVLMTLFRLLGADFSHVGNTVISPVVADNLDKLVGPWGGLRPTMPVITGIDTANVSPNLRIAGQDTVLMLDACLYRSPSLHQKIQHIRSLLTSPE